MNAPNPNHWTLNSCFGVILSIWVHLGPFHYCTKLGAKRARLVQLMQKFMPRCLLGIFHKDSSRSTPLDPKLLFWCVSFLVGCICDCFRYCTKLAAKRAKLVQLMKKFVPRRLVRIFHNKCSRSTPLDLKLMFLCVSFRLGAF